MTKVRSFINKNEYSLDGIAIAVDNDGKCHLNLHDDDENSSKTWKCGLTCRTFESEDRQSIIDLKNDFSIESVEKVRDVLEKLHYSKAYDVTLKKALMNHPVSFHLRN